MSRVRGRVMPVLAAAGVLVGGANLVSYAANGHPLLLGGDNHAVATTTIDNDGHGLALMLKTRRNAPPLAVASHRMVRHLNADLVDGMPGATLRTRSWTYRIGGDSDEGPTVVKSFPGLPPGHYLASYNMVAGLYADGYPMSCWFDTAAQTKAVYGQATQNATGFLVVAASGYVDATGPIAMTCRAAPAFDTISSSQPGQPDSQVTFLRLDTSSVQQSGARARTR